jgi:hypothetical protein
MAYIFCFRLIYICVINQALLFSLIRSLKYRTKIDLWIIDFNAYVINQHLVIFFPFFWKNICQRTNIYRLFIAHMYIFKSNFLLLSSFSLVCFGLEEEQKVNSSSLKASISMHIYTSIWTIFFNENVFV